MVNELYLQHDFVFPKNTYKIPERDKDERICHCSCRQVSRLGVKSRKFDAKSWGYGTGYF